MRASCGFRAGLAAAAVGVLCTPGFASTIIVDDSFADGDVADTPGDPLDSDWWTSSSSSGIEASVGALGFVTGSSGRGIHTIFAPQALGVGDQVKATFTFVTPDTVGSNRSTGFRAGFFDDLGRADLDDNVSASSGTPNDVYGLGVPAFGGVPGLPGYMVDLDVNLSNPDDANITFREHNIAPTSNATGRLMATTSNFVQIENGGDGYSFAANTEYTGVYTITRTTATDTALSFSLSDSTGTLTSFATSDDSGTLTTVAMFGFHANSNTFGSTNSRGEPDNGLDFSNVRIEVGPAIPEPTAAMIALAGLLAAASRRVER